MHNISLRPNRGISPWRKSAVATWRTAADPSVYGSLLIHADPLLVLVDQYRQRGIRLTLTHIVTKAIAIALHQVPEINAVLRWGGLSFRKEVNIFLQAATDDQGEDLSGFVIYNADQKSLEEIARETQTKAALVKSKKDPSFKRMKMMFKIMPPWLIRIFMKLTSFLTYDLNINAKYLGLPRDPMGSAMVTSVGMLGLQEGFAPLVPYSRVPLLLMLGQVIDQPIVKDGQVVAAKVFSLCCTFDHRVADGIHMSRAVNVLKKYLSNPY